MKHYQLCDFWLIDLVLDWLTDRLIWVDQLLLSFIVRILSLLICSHCSLSFLIRSKYSGKDASVYWHLCNAPFRVLELTFLHDAVSLSTHCAQEHCSAIIHSFSVGYYSFIHPLYTGSLLLHPSIVHRSLLLHPSIVHKIISAPSIHCTHDHCTPSIHCTHDHSRSIHPLYTRPFHFHPSTHCTQEHCISIHPHIVHKHTALSSFHRTQWHCISIHQSTHCTQQQQQQKHCSCNYPSIHFTQDHYSPTHPSIVHKILQLHTATHCTKEHRCSYSSIHCTQEHWSPIHQPLYTGTLQLIRASVVHKNIDASPIYPLYIKTSQLELLPKVSNFSICTPCPPPLHTTPTTHPPSSIPLASLQPSLRQ